MNKKQVTGLIIILIGIIIFSSKPFLSLTGFALVDQTTSLNDLWFYLFGIFFILIGFVLVVQRTRIPNLPSLEQIVESYSDLDEEPEFVFSPDTLKLIETHLKKGNPLKNPGQHPVVIFPSSIERSGVSRRTVNYLKSPRYVNARMRNPPDIRRYQEALEDLWTEHWRTESQARNREYQHKGQIHYIGRGSPKYQFSRIKGILKGHVGDELAYAFQRGSMPTVIVDDNPDLKILVDEINKHAGKKGYETLPRPDITIVGSSSYSKAREAA